MREEHYKGYYFREIRRQSDSGMFSRVVGYQAFYGLTLVYDGPSKREMKKWLTTNPPSLLRKNGVIK